MEVVQKDHWYFMVLIFLHFLKGSVQESKAVIVGLEEGMVLRCLCPWRGNLTMVSWTKDPHKERVAVFHPEYGVDIHHFYRDRIEFLRTTPMDGSISIRNVTHRDLGLYQCSVQTFPQGPWTQDFQVEDLDEPPEEDDDEDEGDDDETPEPTTAADAIDVDTELVAEQSNNLTLTCNHKHNGTVNQVVVEWMAHGQDWGIIGVCKKVEGGMVGEDYSDRGSIDCEDSLDVSVHLPGVGQEDGGFYRCTFSTDEGMKIETLLLTVLTPGDFSLTMYMMYVYIGTGAAGLILITVIFILAVRHRKNSRREEYRVKLHPSQKQPNLYENIHVGDRSAKKAKEKRSSPIYANLKSGR